MADVRRLLISLIAAGLLASACSSADPEELAIMADVDSTASTAPDDTTGVDESDDGNDSDDRDEPDASVENDDERNSDYLFAQDQLHTFELTLSADDRAFLDADPTAEQYVSGTLTFEGDTIPVGIRYKGSVGAFVRCVDAENFLQPSGPKICTKLSMKIKINWEDPDAELLGVRKLQFHAMNNQGSLMRERLAYWLYREMGVPAPRSTHARILVNGEFVGIFALTENIDGRFTRENFPDGTGNLYKEAWPITQSGDVQSAEVLIGSLRTNENDADVSAEIMQAFADQLLRSSDRVTVIEQWMDVEALMAQLAVDRTIRHDDGPFHWYCRLAAGGGADGGCGPHNFFWYEDPTAQQVHLIPWDLDNAFANIVEDSNPVTPIPDGLGDITFDCQPFAYGGFNLEQRSASCDPLFATWALMEDQYAAAVQQLHDGPLRAEVIDPLLDAWEAQIRESVTEAAATHDDALPVAWWQASLDELRSALQYARVNPVVPLN